MGIKIYWGEGRGAAKISSINIFAYTFGNKVVNVGGEEGVAEKFFPLTFIHIPTLPKSVFPGTFEFREV